MITLGEQIKKLRKLKKLTQEQFGNYLEVDQTTVSKYENDINIPDIHTLGKMAAIFDVTLDTLVIARDATASEFTQEQGRAVRMVEEHKDITPEDLKKNFNLIVDGRPATDDEIEEAIRYIAIQRMMKEKN